MSEGPDKDSKTEEATEKKHSGRHREGQRAVLTRGSDAGVAAGHGRDCQLLPRQQHGPTELFARAPDRQRQRLAAGKPRATPCACWRRSAWMRCGCCCRWWPSSPWPASCRRSCRTRPAWCSTASSRNFRACRSAEAGREFSAPRGRSSSSRPTVKLLAVCVLGFMLLRAAQHDVLNAMFMEPSALPTPDPDHGHAAGDGDRRRHRRAGCRRPGLDAPVLGAATSG